MRVEDGTVKVRTEHGEKAQLRGHYRDLVSWAPIAPLGSQRKSIDLRCLKGAAKALRTGRSNKAPNLGDVAS
jgi:hypothetical protein